MNRLRLDLFGGFELWSGDRPVAISARKARALLAFLALHQGRPQQRDKLANLLWADSGVSQARTSLRQALTGLRRGLADDGAAVIEANSETVCVATGLIDVDVPAFVRAATGEGDGGLAQAVDLYKGDLLDGLQVDAPEFESWLTAERHRLRELALRSMTALAEHDLAAGDYDRGTRTLTRLLALDPLRESAHRTLMRLFMRQNRPALALKQYRILRDLLRRELAVAPEPESAQLYQEILAQRQKQAPETVDEEAAQLPVAAEAAAPAPAAATPAAPTMALRQASILFADLSGYTELSSRLDPEEVQEILNAYFGCLDDIVARFGGHVDKHVGDGMLAVFGIPTAHSNDSERAIRAALAIHEAMSDLSERIGRLLETHIGIASGRVLGSADGSGTLTGEAVNLAARLTELAPAGQTLVSEDIQRALASRFIGDSLGDLTIRGLSQAVRAWLVRDIVTEQDAGRSHPFVGRRAERRQFERIIDSCLSTDEGMTVLVRGEAGIGKTRLVNETMAFGRSHGVACCRGLILDFGANGGQQAVRSVVRDLVAGSDSELDEDGMRAAADALVDAGVVAAENRSFLYDLVDLPQPVDLRGMYDAMDHGTRVRGLREVLAYVARHAATRRPLMLVFEDAHWADAYTLDQLAALSALTVDAPIIVVITSRTEGEPLDRAWREAAAQAPLMTMDLAPLRDEDAQELAAAMTGRPADQVDAAVSRAAGNPLYLEQLLLSGAGIDGDVPGSVHSIVLARMDTLGDSDRRALQAASILGQQFGLAELRHLLDEPDYEAGELVAEAFFRKEGDGFLFAHALVCDAVYGSQVRSQRRRFHRRAAEYFAKTDPLLQAEHLERAGDPDAAAAYLAASMALADQHRIDRALDCAERGLALVETGTLRYQLQWVHGNMLRDLGRIDPSIAAFRDALGEAETPRDQARAWIGIAKGYRLSDRYGDALRALDCAEALLSPDRDADKLAQLNVLRGNAYFPQGRLEPCLDAHSRALDFARQAQSPLNEARALSGLADAHYLRGDMYTAREQFQRCVELAREHGYVRIEVGNRPMLGIIAAMMLELEEAFVQCRAALDVGQRTGNLRAQLLIYDVLVFLHFLAGDWPAMREDALSGLAIARQLGARRFEGDLLSFLATSEWKLGNTRAAIAAAEEACAVCRDIGMEFSGAAALGVFALVGAGGDDGERRRALYEGEAVLATNPVSHNCFQFYQSAIETALLTGDWDAAERYADKLADYTAHEPLPWPDFVIARGRALAAFGRGVRTPALVAEIRGLRERAVRAGLNCLDLPADDLPCAG